MNIQTLIDFHKYGLYHQGDAQRDTVDALEVLSETQAKMEDMQDSIKEAVSSLPEEDFLAELMDALISAKDAKTKAEKQEYIEEALKIAGGIQTELNSSTEYIVDLLK